MVSKSVENNYKGHALRITVGITALVLMLTGGAGAATPISSCTTISSPGEYLLTQSITNSPATYCMNIISSNVVFDGAGYAIDGADIVNTYGVYVYSSITAVTNVTIKNLTVTDWYYGIHYRNAANGNITNNIAISNNNRGISLDSSINNMLSSNIANSNYLGIYLVSSSNNNTLTVNNASNNNYGILLSNSSNNILNENTANSNNGGDGFYLHYSSNNNTLRGNNASNNGPYADGIDWTLPTVIY